MGAIVVVIALVIVIPVSVIISGGVLSAVLAFFVQKDVDDSNPESELLNLNG